MAKIVWVQIWVQNCGVLEIKKPGFLQGPVGALHLFIAGYGLLIHQPQEVHYARDIC